MQIIITFFIIISLLLPNALMPIKANEAVKSAVQVQPEKIIKQVPKANLKHTVGAWMPYWDQKNAVKSFQKNKEIINELSPYWYFVKPNGKLQATGKFDVKTIEQAKKSGVKVIPMVSNDFDGSLISRIINNPSLRKAHINTLVDKVVKRDLDGIDLDYEGLLAKDRKMYAYFVKVLAQKLHQHNKMLSVTVVAKTKEPGLSSGAKAANWKELGKHADRIRIMAYDYHWKTSSPGPIAPKFWIEQIAKFAKKTIPSRKIIIAVGTYGYNWVGGRAQAITMAQAKQLSKKSKQPIRRDARSNEQFLKLGSGKPRIWLQDSGSLKAKIDIVKKYNLGGIVFWRLGDEDAANWHIVKNHLL